MLCPFTVLDYFVTGMAHMEFTGANTVILAKKINGDKQSWLYVKHNQIFKAEYVEGILSEYTANININISNNATLHTSRDLKIDGTQLNLRGRITANNLIVERGGNVHFSRTSFTASYGNGVYTATSGSGSYVLSRIVLKSGSNFKTENGLRLQVSLLDLRRYVKISANSVNVTAGKLILERGAELNVDGGSEMLNPPSSGQGHGTNGGAYASQGGIGQNQKLSQASEPYGTIYFPELPGSAGGNGAAGGGIITLLVNDLVLDGTLSANGLSKANSGGGSGGSINVQCDQTMSGFGLITSSGGSAYELKSGAGSGGRIAIRSNNDLFTGKFKASGGSSPATYGNGGPGSIYLKTVDQGTISERLIVDNSNGQKTFYMNLEEPNQDLEFSAVKITNFAKIKIKEDGKNRTIDIKKIFGDGTGLLLIQKNQKGTLERYATGKLSISKLEINLELHNGGKFILSETTTILGKASTALDLDGIVKGVSNLIVGPRRHMRIGSNARIVPFKETAFSRQSPVSFGLLQLDPGSSIDYDPNNGADIILNFLSMKFNSKMTADYFNITCSDIDLELESILSSSSDDRISSNKIDITNGMGITTANGYGGAGHGSAGGKGDRSPDSSGQAYGSLYTPLFAGSRANPKGGHGGGKIYLHIGNKLINDGSIKVDGGSSQYGGGSGGSILVLARQIEGYGSFSSVGGSSSRTSGAGAAGRIALYCNQKEEFEGIYHVYGGEGAQGINSGGPGTLYIEDWRNGQVFERLFIDNKNRPIEKVVSIKEGKQDRYEFDEVHVYRRGSLEIAAVEKNITWDIRKIFGDRSGLIQVHQMQKLIAEYEEASGRDFLSGINFIVDYKGEIILPSSYYIYGYGVQMTGYSERRSLQLYGRLTGVIDLVIGQGSLVYMGSQAHTSVLSKGKYIYMDSEGSCRFATVDLRGSSTWKYAPDTTMNVSVGQIDARYESLVSAESIYITANSVKLEAGSKLTTSAADRPLDTLDEPAGLGRGGTGGGHASEGGGGVFDSTHRLLKHGGRYYGSLYRSVQRGSASEGSNGGKGGGIINLNIAKILYVDGNVTSVGSDSNQGAGSGGCVMTNSVELEGYGRFDVSGGGGVYGGSGGRIKIHIGNESYFHGSFVAAGGAGSNYRADGGPGSVFIEDIRYLRPYYQLRLDNGKFHWDNVYVLDETSRFDFFFHEVHLLNNATLRIKVDHQNRTLKVIKIIGDMTGRIHLQKGHTAHLEESKSVGKTAANIWIDEGAKVYLSSVFYVMGLGEVALKWNGEMIGVRHMRIIPGRKSIIGSKAQTSFVDSSGHYQAGVPGWFRFGTFEIGAGSLLNIPPPMGLKLTVGILVSLVYSVYFALSARLLLTVCLGVG